MSVYIIAEAGVNHNGSLEEAKKLYEQLQDGKDVKKKLSTTANFVKYAIKPYSNLHELCVI